MKTYTIDDIRAIRPCYDPARYLPEDWSGTLLDILDVEDCPSTDRVWVVTHFLSDRTNRLFAVWCVRQALALIDNLDPRIVAACAVTEQYANGEVTDDELRLARHAAWNAAWDISPAVSAAAWAASVAASDSTSAIWRVAYCSASWCSEAPSAKAAHIDHLREMIYERY